MGDWNKFMEEVIFPEANLKIRGSTTPLMPSDSPTITSVPGDIAILGEQFSYEIRELQAIFEGKSKEYNSITGMDAYYPYGYLSIVNALNEKLVRAANLVNRSGSCKRENLRDMAIVAIMGIMMLNKYDG